MVEPKLVERSLPTPKVHGSNPVIGIRSTEWRVDRKKNDD